MTYPKRPVAPRVHAWLASALMLALVLSLSLGTLRNTLTPAHAAPATPRAATAEERVPKLPDIIRTPSKNYRASRGRTIDTVVVHFLSAINIAPSRWSDPQLALDILRDNRVSAHYMIDRAGQVYRLVDEKNVAWHAGGSIMPAPDNRRNVNSFSIGIEMIATRTSGYTDAQYDSLAALITGIKSRHPIRHLVGHDQISGTRAVRLGLRSDVKPDPGPMFDWARLRAMVD